MGATLGIVAAPCVGPFVIGLFTFVAAKQDLLLGFWLFFFLALGLGAPYFVLALFSGKIKALPKSGEWMDGIKHIFGVVMIIMAIYFLLPLFPKSIEDYVLPVAIIIGFGYLIYDQKGNSVPVFRNIKYVLSGFAILVSLYFLFKPVPESIAWIKYEQNDYERNIKQGNVIMLDFYADWCLPCKELDKLTFTNSEVIKESRRFATYKIDLTKYDSQTAKEAIENFKIIGVPTLIFIDSKGKEAKRINKFVSAEELLKIMREIE
jgi:thiol:disulfide interchange protein DsbD